MKNIDLLRAINDIDDKYIEEAMPSAYKKERHIGIFKYIPAFFGLMLVAVLGIKMINIGVDEDFEYSNPIVEYQTLALAQEAIGFEFGVDFSNLDDLSFVVIDNEILEISNSDNSLICRKAKGSEDRSGDFSAYSSINNVDINGVDVTVKESDGNTLITFIYDGFFYSFSSSYLSVNELLSFVEDITK